MKKSLLAVIALSIAVSSFGATGAELAKKNKLDPVSKTISQWERDFKNPRQEEFKNLLNSLSATEKADLLKFLTDGAQDGKKPTAAGTF